MKQIIEDLYPMNRCQLGSGYDSALLYLSHLIDLKILEFPSGTKLGTWTVPDEWVAKDAWVKRNGEKIIDYKTDPLSLAINSEPISGEVPLKELFTHLFYSDTMPDHYPYQVVSDGWGFTYPRNKIFTKAPDGTKTELLSEEDTYEVFIDSEKKPGVMKVGVHTIKGKTDREVLIFAHLDYPYQANENLSGVAVAMDLLKDIKPEELEHTVKIIFCPENIGSIAYAMTQDISKVDFAISLKAVGTQGSEGTLLQQAFDKTNRINTIANLALRGLGEGFRQGPFRSALSSDEYVFNDPTIGIPSILLSTHPYPEYHTSADTPEIINYAVLEHVKKAIIKTIRYYEEDFIPTRNFKGPLNREGFGINSLGEQYNLSWDYFIYSIDGEKTFSQLCTGFGLNFEHAYEQFDKLVSAGIAGRSPIAREVKVKSAPRKKHEGNRRKADAPVEPRKVPKTI